MRQVRGNLAMLEGKAAGLAIIRTLADVRTYTW